MFNKTNFPAGQNGEKIIGLGETHHGQHDQVLKQLLSNVQDLNGIFWEQPIDYQSSIDHFLETGELDEKLSGEINGARKEGKEITEGYNLIRDFALKNNWPVVCIDSSKAKIGDYKNESKFGRYFLRGNSRDEDMAEEVLRVFEEKEGNWVIIGGFQHLKYGKHFRTGETTLGSRLKEKLGEKFTNVCLLKVEGQDLAVYDTRNGIDPKLVEFGIENFKFDIYVVRG